MCASAAAPPARLARPYVRGRTRGPRRTLRCRDRRASGTRRLVARCDPRRCRRRRPDRRLVPFRPDAAQGRRAARSADVRPAARLCLLPWLRRGVAPALRVRTGGGLQPRLRRAPQGRRPGTALRPRHGYQHCGADLAPGIGLRRRRRSRRGRAAPHRDCVRRRGRSRRRRAPAAAPRSTPPHSR